MSRRAWRMLAVVLLLANLAVYFWPRAEVLPPAPAVGVETLQLYQPHAVTVDQQRAPAVRETESSIESAAEVSTEVETLAAVPVEEERVATVQAPVCYELGPLPGGALAPLRNQIDDEGLAARLTKRTVPDRADYWTYLDPEELGGLGPARERLAELGVDSYPIASGALQGMMSLGLFSTLERAQRLQRQMQQRDLPAVVFERQRFRDEFWLIANSEVASAKGWGQGYENFPYPVTNISHLSTCDALY